MVPEVLVNVDPHMESSVEEGNNDVSGPEADWSMNWADP